jgi:hypothetical protein
MVPVYSPLTESEAAVISAMLEAHGIHFFIRGGAFSKLYPGMQIKDYNTQTFMVPEESYELARDLLAEFIKPSTQEVTSTPKRSIWRKLRVLIEAFCFGWVITGDRWDKNDK